MAAYIGRNRERFKPPGKGKGGPAMPDRPALSTGEPKPYIFALMRK
jgi:hypothetical protein